MGPEFLIDTNIAIASLGNKLPQEGAFFMKAIPPAISVITQIELLGWYGVSAVDLIPLTSFVDKSFIYPINPAITDKCIWLSQNHHIKTPDAIIAATALVHNLTLLTRNTGDFKRIEGLKFVNPFELEDSFDISAS